MYVCVYTYTYMYIHTYIHTQGGILFSNNKEGNPAICDNMDESWGHYAKWNKSEKNKSHLYVKSKNKN